MKHLKFPLIAILLLSFIIGCQKELSYEQPILTLAEGSLKSDLSGDCLPMSVKGTYKAGVNLGDTNYVDIEINVTKIGSYAITTNATNGYSFTASGNFTTTGTVPVRLKANGKPTMAGTDDFNVTFDSTICFFSINVITGPPPPSGPAVFTLAGTPGNCPTPQFQGNYVKNIALNASNTVTLNVNVTTAGSYTVTTNTVNGMTFSGTGAFSSTGAQTIVLTGSGTPTASGSFNILVTAGTSTCSFSVIVTDTAPPPGSNTDYFPLTQNSYWTYDDGSGSDTSKTTNTGTATFNGNIYQRFISVDDTGDPFDTSYYRKDNSNGFYYNFIPKHVFEDIISPFTFSGSGADVLFMKNTLTSGATWNSDHAVTASGFPFTFRFKFTCTNANATVVVNGKTFTNVYVVQSLAQAGSAGVFSDLGTPIDFLYAKGIGLIKFDDGFFEQDIRFWQIN